MAGILRWKPLKRKEQKPEVNTTVVFLKHCLAGGLAGGISRTATAPFDRMKIFYQVTKTRKRIPMKQVLDGMIKEGGFLSLWRGNFVNVIKTVPKSAMRFSVYDKTKKILLRNSKNKELSSFHKIIAGSVAGFLTQLTTYPMDVLKIRMSLRKTGQYYGLIDAVIKIKKSEGIMTFYRGFLANLISIIPYSGLELGGYEITKLEYSNLRGRDLMNFELFLVSGVSSFLSQTATYPLIVVVTRMQAWTTEKPNAVRIFLNIYKEEGFHGYFSGLLPNLIKFVPAMAITYFTYENMIYVLGTSMSAKE